MHVGSIACRLPPWSPSAMCWYKKGIFPAWLIVWPPEDVDKEMLPYGSNEGLGTCLWYINNLFFI